MRLISNLDPEVHLVHQIPFICERAVCPTITENEPKIIPYFTRMIKVNYVGFEPTTSAAFLDRVYLRDRSEK
jgi:hypothetical protein